MKNYLITFLLLFLVVQFVSAGSLLPSKVYAEDGYHCGKVLDVQTSFEAESPSILLVTAIHYDFASGYSFSIEKPVQIEVPLKAQVSINSDIWPNESYLHRVISLTLSDNYLARTFHEGINRLARDGLDEDRVILVFQEG